MGAPWPGTCVIDLGFGLKVGPELIQGVRRREPVQQDVVDVVLRLGLRVLLVHLFELLGDHCYPVGQLWVLPEGLRRHVGPVDVIVAVPGVHGER